MKEVLSDRERILTEIISRLSSTQTLVRNNNGWSSEPFKDSHGGMYVHFAYWDTPKAGDLVLARTGNVSEWKIGWYVEPLPNDFGGAVIREIGSQRTCNYSNECFVPIVGLNKYVLLEGDARQFYVKVLTAFQKGDEYIYRFGGLDLHEQTAFIWVREVFGGLGGQGHESVPFSIRMEWTPKTSVKAILAAMRDGGYGTHKFERRAINVV